MYLDNPTKSMDKLLELINKLIKFSDTRIIFKNELNFYMQTTNE